MRSFNDQGELVWEAEYDIYGRLKKIKTGADIWNRPIWGEVDKSFIPFRQMGQYEDEELGGLYYNRFRYYDSGSGVYISQDPIGLLSGEFNLYSYVHDTNSWVDIFGLDFFYQLMKDGKIVYNGITKNEIKNRIRDHINDIRKDFNEFKFLEVDGRVASRDLERSALHNANGEGLQNVTRIDRKYYHSYDPKKLKSGRIYYNPTEIDAKMKGAKMGKIENGKIKCH